LPLLMRYPFVNSRLGLSQQKRRYIFPLRTLRLERSGR
jgi:hypothetical protein